MRRGLVVVASVLVIALLGWLALSGPEGAAEESSQAAGSAEGATTESAPGTGPASRPYAGGVRGRVLRDGKGVDGALVTAKGTVTASARTMDDGSYLLDALPAGPYALTAAQGNGVAAPRWVEIVAGETASGVELTLAASTSVRLLVLDVVSRRPVVGAVVVSATGARATSAEGAAELRGERGRTWVDVSAPGYLSRSLWVDFALAKDGAVVDVALTPASRIKGKVQTQGTPSAGATVWAEYLEGARAGDRSAVALADRGGAYALELKEGLLRVVAVTARGLRAQSPPVRVAVGQELTLDVEANVDATHVSGRVRTGDEPLAGAQLSVVDVRDEHVAAFVTSRPDGTFTVDELITGSYVVQVRKGSLAVVVGPFAHRGDGASWDVVVASAGTVRGRVEPAQAGVRVRLRQGAWSGPLPEVLTDADGRFQFEGVQGEFLWLDAEGPSGGATAQARPGDDVVLRLSQSALVVHLRDADGRPVGEAAITARSVDTGAVRRFPVVAPNGDARLELAPGTWDVSVEVDGRGRGGPERAVIAAGGGAEVTLRLEGGVVAQGLVRDEATGLPLQGVRVTATVRNGIHLARFSVATDARGSFALPPQPPAAWVEFSHPAYHRWGAQVGQLGSANVALKPLPNPQGQQQEPQYEGVGMLLALRGPTIVVDGVNAGSPAEAAGVQPGDAIIAIEGAPTRPGDVNDVVARIRGPAGSPVRVRFERQGRQFDLVLRRRVLLL